MDRNTIVGIVLIGLIFVIFSYFNSNQRTKSYEQELRTADSLYLEKDYSAARTAYLKALSFKPSESYPRQQVVTIDSLISLTRQDTVSNTGQKVKQTVTTSPVTTRQKAKVPVDTFPSEENKLITVENDLMKIQFSSKGGRVYAVVLKNYRRYDSLPLVLFRGDSTEFGFRFFTADNRLIETSKLFFSPQTDTSYIRVKDSTYTLAMRYQANDHAYIEYLYTIHPDEYMIDLDVRLEGMNKIIASNLTTISLNWNMYIPQQERGRQNENNYTTIKYKFFQDEVSGLRMRSNKPEMEEDVPTRIEWLAYKDQFFSSVLIAKDEPFQNAFVKSTRMAEGDPYLRFFESELSVPYHPADHVEIPMQMYFGPNYFKTLKKYGRELTELVYLGKNIIRWVNRYVIITIFNWLHKYISSYGIIILLLTLIIKMALFPLTYKSYASQAKMRVLKPFVDEINARFPKKEDSMKKQQAQMALYKRAGVSPLGGCLPMILQLPILYAMFRFFPTSIELRQQSFLWAHDLSTYDSILQLPFTIPMYGDHVSLFTILMTASTIITMKINSPSSSGSQQMPGMKGMTYIMPLMFMLILNNFSAALNYYYFLANLITFGQNMLAKSFINEEEILKKVRDSKGKPVQKSKWQKRLEEASKSRGYPPPKKRK
ncbi:MAG: membrane protein insertase YidC [Chlorobi bacterium]|nr:membrane protein insertase YidC [Chlorobiota bacterium]